MHMCGFPLKKINVKLAYAYWGHTKIYFLNRVTEQKSLRSPGLKE